MAVFKICKSYGANINPLNARTHAVAFDVTETARESAYNCT